MTKYCRDRTGMRLANESVTYFVKPRSLWNAVATSPIPDNQMTWVVAGTQTIPTCPKTPNGH